MALTSTTADAAPQCTPGRYNTCFYSGQNLTGDKEGASSLPNNCLHVDAFTAHSAWNRSAYKLTVYEKAGCTGHYQSTGPGGKINRPTWGIGFYKLT
ncbi:peptidase inhibitor family I36 protein [Streptomyces sp. NPDC001604]|uniref:peptidase inhibitor family I36 protein n=1 Tax=Streptomyces sp. NPDC001604 TaxID=3364593 RepID=UPI0036CE6DB1